MQCAEMLRVQGYFDGEADAFSAAQIEAHLEHCPECRELLSDLERLRAGLRHDVDYARAPPALRKRVLEALDREHAAGGRPRLPESPLRRKRTFWTGALLGAGGTAAAASLALLLLLPPRVDPLLGDLVSAHLRSLMPAHLIDVASTDRHTVKPWFASHADVSPVVADFQQQGYRLVGGRADYFDHQRTAVVVYQHGAHIINVFSWAAEQGDLRKNTTRNGYHLVFWRAGNVMYCAVSDAGWNEVLGLSTLLQAAATQNDPP